MVAAEVVDDVGNTSAHLECASTMIRNMDPRNGPA